MKTNTLYSFTLMLLALSSAAPAALTAYDGFDYGATPGNLTGKNGGSGWSGAYTTGGDSTRYSATGLTYTTLETTGGSTSGNDGTGTTTQNFREFGTTYGDGETETWFSFLAQRNGATATNKFVGFSLYNGTTAEMTIATTTAGSLQWRIFDNGNSQSVNSGVGIAANTTYLLAARIVWGAGAGGTDAVSLFVNPTLGSTPGTANATKDIDMVSFDTFRFASQDAVNYSFDEIRVGDSFTSVTPVPEPSSSAALLLGLSTLALRRRRSS